MTLKASLRSPSKKPFRVLSWLNDYSPHVSWSAVIVLKSGTRAGTDPVQSREEEHEPAVSA